MSSRPVDRGFMRHCAQLVLKIISYETDRPEPSWYDIKLSLYHISWIWEMGMLRPDEDLSRQIRTLNNMTNRICTINYHTRLSWEQQRTFSATAVLRLLTKYVKYNFKSDSEGKSMVENILGYIKTNDPELFTPDVSGNFNLAFINCIYACCKTYKSILDDMVTPAPALDTEGEEISERFEEIFRFIFSRHDTSEEDFSNASPF